MLSSPKGVWSVVKNVRNKTELTSNDKLLALFPDVTHAVEHVNTLFSDFFHSNGTCTVTSSPICNDRCKNL